MNIQLLITYIQAVIVDAIRLLDDRIDGMVQPVDYELSRQEVGRLTGHPDVKEEEVIIFLLALLPHISPQTLDLFFIKNRQIDRLYTEFGGWRGQSHNGFLPTGETAAFLIMRKGPDKRKEILRILGREHWFYQERILWLEGQGDKEPYLSGKLCMSDETLSTIYGIPYEPEYTSAFPAKRITTSLVWKDLVLPYDVMDELDEINKWIASHHIIRNQWNLDHIIKPGFRCLLYGPPGTGKTLTVQLLGKENKRDVYRVDLSMIISKYIGETEKNLAAVFDKAAYHNWILFFDEADALFGQRTDTNSSNDRHANQEVAYLLQRIEDFPGIVILATNLKENMDEAFLRRFQHVLYFPVPDEGLRFHLWKNMIPPEWLDGEELLHEAARVKLAGGNIINVIRSCAVRLYDLTSSHLTKDILLKAIRREQMKEGKLL